MRIHLIPNSHIDPVWLWNKHEGIDEVLNTFRSACDRLDEFPGLTFSASSLQFYEWVLQYEPELFARIQRFAAAGRWEITGGWWVEADSNLPSEYSLEKQAFYAREFAARHFNQDMVTAFLPDGFGHPASLPKILAGSGFRNFVFCRPGVHEKKDLPANLFWWEYKGQRILAYRLINHYFSRPEALKILDPEYDRYPVNCFFFGVGNHGGGPTIKEIGFYNELLRARPELDAGYSSCERFFAEAEAQIAAIPEYSGDLHYHAVGCYSALRGLKNSIRGAERNLAFAGRAAALTGGEPLCLDTAWKTLLFNQFHDIYPGSCSPQAAENAAAESGGAGCIAFDAGYNALKMMSSAAPVRVAEGEYRIFNTMPHEITVPLSIETSCRVPVAAPFTDNTGQELFVQYIAPEVRTDSSLKWEFIDTLPAQGFKSYHFDCEHSAESEAGTASFIPGKKACGSRYILQRKGKLFEAGSGAPLLKKAARFEVIEDNSDTWAHGVRAFGRRGGSFRPAVSGVNTGAVSARLFERYNYENSRLELQWSAYHNLPGIYATVGVVWSEQRSILKWRIKPRQSTGKYYWMQTPGGYSRRPADGSEQPLLHWLWLPSGNGRGWLIIQDGAFACDCMNGALRLTLVRSSVYAWHDPHRLSDCEPQRDTDQGRHDFRFRLLPDTAFDPDNFERLTAAFLEPCFAIREGKK